MYDYMKQEKPLAWRVLILKILDGNFEPQLPASQFSESLQAPLSLPLSLSPPSALLLPSPKAGSHFRNSRQHPRRCLSAFLYLAPPH